MLRITIYFAGYELYCSKRFFLGEGERGAIVHAKYNDSRIVDSNEEVQTNISHRSLYFVHKLVLNQVSYAHVMLLFTMVINSWKIGNRKRN